MVEKKGNQIRNINKINKQITHKNVEIEKSRKRKLKKKIERKNYTKNRGFDERKDDE